MANGVKVATAYISVEADVSGIDKQVRDGLDKAGQHARPAGKKMGKEISEGISGALRDAGSAAVDEFKKNWGNQIAGELKSGQLKQGFEDIGNTVRNATDAMSRAGGVFGQNMDIIRRGGEDFGTLFNSIGTGAQTAVTELGKVTGAVSDLKNGDLPSTLGAVSSVLKDFGQGDTSSKIDEIQHKFGDLKGNVKGTADELMTLTGNSGKIAGGLGAIGAAAGPLAATFAALTTLMPGFSDAMDRVLSGKGSFHDWANFLSPGTNLIDLAFKNLPKPSSAPSLPPIPGGPRGSVSDLLQDTGGGAVGGTGGGSNFYKDWYQNGGGASVAPSGLAGVPLMQTPSGAWTSPNAAWAHLIQRESSGINQRQGIHDVNSGGNEAEGIFQITPATWRSHGGGEFAPTALAATPQQQAVVAARILQRNPSGSDWGAGLSGRENASALLAGIASYDDGGEVPNDQIAQVHGGERVLSADEYATLGGAQGVQAALDKSDASPNPLESANRTAGYVPAAAAGNAGAVAGTSSLAGLLNLGNQAAAGLIDTGASAAQAGLAAGTFGIGGMAGGIGIQMGATEAKRAVSYGFQVLSILGDAAIEQLFPFGAPRWLGYDYTQFAPQLNISQIGTTTAEKAVQQAMGQGATPGEPQAGSVGSPLAPAALGVPGQIAGGPVTPTQLPGLQPLGAPDPKYGSNPPGAPPPISLGGAQGGVGAGFGGSSAPASQFMTGSPIASLDMPNSTASPPPQQQALTPWGLLGAGLFDEGGVWPSGTAGVNMSGRPELVLNPNQIDALSAPRPADTRAGDTYYLMGGDSDEIIRGIDKKKKLAAMRYTGRF